jgi:regulation of enolase protein 1 (concanavalin A-like superfamily)
VNNDQLAKHTLEVCLFAGLLCASLIGTPLTVHAQTTQPGWTRTGIGTVAATGTVTYGATSMSVTSNGNDVNGTSDQLSFVYRQITGNATVIAKVTSLPALTAFSQVGVMIRESLAANARHGYAVTTAGNGTSFRRRTSVGGATASTAALDFSAPGGAAVTASWLKLQRTASVITASWSSDGVVWSQIAAATVTLPSTAYVGIAVSSHSTTAITATVSNVLVVGNGTLDAGLTGADIGAPALSGGSWASAGAMTLDGAGTGIAGTTDQFRFVYKSMAGDMDIVTRVVSFESATTNARAGIMVRSTTGATSAHRSLLVGSQDVQFLARATTGGSTSVTSAGAHTPPLWLKASRRGSVLTFSQSTNGQDWGQVSQQAASGTYLVGVVVTSAASTKLVRARFDNTSIAAIAAPNQPPAVSLTSPASSLSISGPLALAATAGDSDGSIAAVEFYANSTLLGTDTTAPYQSTFNATLVGSYTIKAVARDNIGASTTSATRTVTVTSVLPNVAPLVSLTSPQTGQAFTLPTSVTMSATASDSDGSVQRVDFYNSTTLLYSDTVAPYSYTWTNPAAGAYALRAVAYDNRGAMTQSSTRDITVATVAIPSKVVFTAGSIWDLVLWYVLDIFPAGADPAVAQPVATVPLGLPALFAYQATVDVRPAILALPPGQYIATVSSVSLLEGTLRSSPSPAFTR